MKGLMKGIAIFLVIVLLSCLLTPLVYKYTDFKFERILKRFLMVFILLAIILHERAKRSRAAEFGIVFRKDSLGWFFKGVSVGFFTLVLMSAAEIMLGACRFNFDIVWNEVPFLLAKFLIGALLIGLIEEFFFRGYLYTRFKYAVGIFTSLILTNIIYSLVHFISFKEYIAPPEPTFWDSLGLTASLFKPFLDWQGILPGFFGLFLFGLVLSYAFLRSKSLFLAVGIHSGAVIFLKLDGFFLEKVPASSALLFGEKAFYGGLLSWAFMGVMIVWVTFMTRRKRRLPPIS